MLDDSDYRRNFIHLLKELHDEQDFQSALELWELASKKLWDSGYRADYLDCAQIMLAVAQKSRDRNMEAFLWNELGWAYMERGERAHAQKHFEISLDAFVYAQNLAGQSRALRDLGSVFDRQDRVGTALRYYAKALKVVRNAQKITNDEEQTAWLHREAELHNLFGSIYLKLRDYKRSGYELLQSLQQYQKLGSEYIYYQIAPIMNIGRWFFYQHTYDCAETCLNICIELSKQVNRPDTGAGAYVRMANIRVAQKRTEDAIYYLDLAQQVASTEHADVRERAAQLKYEILNARKKTFKLLSVTVSRYLITAVDLLLNVPIIGVRAGAKYLFRYVSADRELQKVKKQLMLVVSDLHVTHLKNSKDKAIS